MSKIAEQDLKKLNVINRRPLMYAPSLSILRLFHYVRSDLESGSESVKKILNLSRSVYTICNIHTDPQMCSVQHAPYLRILVTKFKFYFALSSFSF